MKLADLEILIRSMRLVSGALANPDVAFYIPRGGLDVVREKESDYFLEFDIAESPGTEISENIVTVEDAEARANKGDYSIALTRISFYA